MNRTTLIACAALISATAAPAFATDVAPSAARTAAQPTAQRVVMNCERDPLTQAAFRNTHGARPVFVTAEEVARSSGERWTAPRCMSAREQQRLARMMGHRAQR